MARIYEPSDADLQSWATFVASRPENVRAVAERFDPWTLYRLKPTGSRVTLFSFGEENDGSVTLTVDVTAKYNLVLFERQVFGIEPEDLEECNLPAPGEELGALMDQEDVRDNIDVLRSEIRPDLWDLDGDGKAVRKEGV